MVPWQTWRGVWRCVASERGVGCGVAWRRQWLGKDARLWELLSDVDTHTHTHDTVIFVYSCVKVICRPCTPWPLSPAPRSPMPSLSLHALPLHTPCSNSYGAPALLLSLSLNLALPEALCSLPFASPCPATFVSPCLKSKVSSALSHPLVSLLSLPSSYPCLYFIVSASSFPCTSLLTPWSLLSIIPLSSFSCFFSNTLLFTLPYFPILFLVLF